MRNLILGSFAAFVILSQVACSDDSQKAAAQAYADANGCTVLGMAPHTLTPPASPAASAAQAQVPCSLQKGTAVAAAAVAANPAVANGQVPTQPPPSLSQAKLNDAIKAQSAKVQAQLAALPPEQTPAPSRSIASDIASIPPAQENAPAPLAKGTAGEGDASR